MPSLYTISVVPMIQYLGSLKDLLQKGEEFCKSRGTDPKNLLASRLHVTMFPFVSPERRKRLLDPLADSPPVNVNLVSRQTHLSSPNVLQHGKATDDKSSQSRSRIISRQ